MGAADSKPISDNFPAPKFRVTAESEEGQQAKVSSERKEEPIPPLHFGELIDGRWELTKKLGEGSYGDVYEALDIDENKPVAIKFEDENASRPKLAEENMTYKVLWNTMEEVVGFPRAHAFGSYGKRKFLVIDRLGASLEELLRGKKRLPMNLVLTIGYQALVRLQHMHKRNFLHRDIKPGNFVVGRPRGADRSKLILYLIDFGLSKRYRYNMSLTHIPYGKRKRICGTISFMSINTHLGIEQSRRDDLESLGYMLVYLGKGSLPWDELCAKNQDHKATGRCKMQTSLEQLCRGLPRQMCEYFSYVRSLDFLDCPDYCALGKKFHQAMKEQ